MWFVLALAVALLLRNPWVFVYVSASVLLADGIASIVKLAVGEKRPAGTDPLVVVPHSNSFPSGHSATAFAGATALSLVYPRGAPVFYVLAAAIAYSRLYLGVHYPLDVLGGAAIGVATALLLREAIRRRSPRLLPGG